MIWQPILGIKERLLLSLARANARSSLLAYLLQSWPEEDIF